MRGHAAERTSIRVDIGQHRTNAEITSSQQYRTNTDHSTRWGRRASWWIYKTWLSLVPGHSGFMGEIDMANFEALTSLNEMRLLLSVLTRLVAIKGGN